MIESRSQASDALFDMYDGLRAPEVASALDPRVTEVLGDLIRYVSQLERTVDCLDGWSVWHSVFAADGARLGGA